MRGGAAGDEDTREDEDGADEGDEGGVGQFAEDGEGENAGADGFAQNGDGDVGGGEVFERPVETGVADELGEECHQKKEGVDVGGVAEEGLLHELGHEDEGEAGGGVDHGRVAE